jgi:hypothetical protein
MGAAADGDNHFLLLRLEMPAGVHVLIVHQYNYKMPVSPTSEEERFHPHLEEE